MKSTTNPYKALSTRFPMAPAIIRVYPKSENFEIFLLKKIYRNKAIQAKAGIQIKKIFFKISGKPDKRPKATPLFLT